MDGFADVAFDVLQDAVVDTLWLVPFLFVTYLFMEWLEHRASDRFQKAIQQAGPAGPVVGAVLGVIPQCGFSGAASTLYAARVVSLGTLIAVFLSTSDEMLPIFIAEQVPASTIAGILVAKIVIGIVAGIAIDAVMRLAHREHRDLHIHDLCEHDHCSCESDGHDHDDAHEGGRHPILASAVKHTLQVTLFVFVIVLALNAVLAVVGEDALGGFINANPLLAVFASALVGLIPNCAASVAIAQLYVDGLLGAGAMLAGLLSAAGIGLLVLFRTNRHPKENLGILAGLWCVSVVCGLAVNALGITF